jgi:long-chain fatty acid transport protein
MHHRFILPLSIVLLFTASLSHAGGLWIRDFGSVSQGRSNAGEAAGVESAGTVAHNPAGMALLKENEMAASGFALIGDIEFDIDNTTPPAGDNDGGTIGSTAPAGGLGYVHKLNERWSVGIGVAGFTGAQLDYNDDWVGRYQAQRVELLGIAAVPAISWQATDKLSLGLALPVLYTDLELDVAIPNLQDPINGPDGQASLDGDDTNVGVQAGAIYEFTDRTRLGVMYMTKFDQSFSGGVDLDLAVGSATVAVNTDLTFAEMVRVGLAHAINDHYTLYLGAGWENWSEFADVLITGESNSVSLPTNWKDTWHVSSGIRYRKSDGFEMQFGAAYDSSPVDNEDRRADLPVDRQWRVSTSASWQHNKRWRYGTFLTYMDLGSSNISSSDFFDGDFDKNRIFMIGANLQFFPRR